MLQEAEPAEQRPLDGMIASRFAVTLPQTSYRSRISRAVDWVFSPVVRAFKGLLRAVAKMAQSTQCCLRRQKAKLSPTDGSLNRECACLKGHYVTHLGMYTMLHKAAMCALIRAQFVALVTLQSDLQSLPAKMLSYSCFCVMHPLLAATL